MHKHLTALLVMTIFGGFALGEDLPVRSDLTPEDLERVRAVTAPATDFTKPEQFEGLPAGAATTRELVNRDSFSHSSANLTFEQEGDFKLGNALFRKVWVSSPVVDAGERWPGAAIQCPRLPELPPQGWSGPSSRDAGGERRFNVSPSFGSARGR